MPRNKVFALDLRCFAQTNIYITTFVAEVKLMTKDQFSYVFIQVVSRNVFEKVLQ